MKFSIHFWCFLAYFKQKIFKGHHAKDSSYAQKTDPHEVIVFLEKGYDLTFYSAGNIHVKN